MGAPRPCVQPWRAIMLANRAPRVMHATGGIMAWLSSALGAQHTCRTAACSAHLYSPTAPPVVPSSGWGMPVSSTSRSLTRRQPCSDRRAPDGALIAC